MSKTKLIIFSGGMDSGTLLYAEKENIKTALGFHYGQKHQKELEYAASLCSELEIPYYIIDLTSITPFMKSALLLSGGNIPEGHYEDISMKQTVVPFRNGIMLSIAAGIAESNECSSVLIANHAGDHAIYPDCRHTFIGAMKDAFHFGTYTPIQLEAPFTLMSKRDIAVLGKELGIDYSKTWSCYKGKEFHCGKCGTCVERKEALEGFDTTIYEEK